MDDAISIPSPLGLLTLRSEREDDQAFRYDLFCVSRPPEWDMVQIDPHLREQLNRHQFAAQTGSYRTQFARARFDIIELGAERIGRIVVDRPGDELHIVDQAIAPHMRNKGLGTTIMRALMDEAAAARVPVRLTVGSSNDPSLRLYLRLGFVPTGAVPMHIEMRWVPTEAAGP
jgi:ribosomal protein S18 acetylase RimI-like enzyme